MRRRNRFEIDPNLNDFLKLEARQKAYRELMRDCAKEVISLLGGVENPKQERQAVAELAGALMNAVAIFVVEHTKEG